MWGDHNERKPQPIDESFLMPRTICGYCSVWGSVETVGGEGWSVSRAGLQIPKSIALLDSHDWRSQLGHGQLVMDSVGLFFTGRFSRTWLAVKMYENLLTTNDYFGFSLAASRKGQWRRSGKAYEITEYDQRPFEVSLSRNPVFKRTFALLCHANEVDLIRGVLKLRLRHGLSHLARRDWQSPAKAAALTMNVVKKLGKRGHSAALSR